MRTEQLIQAMAADTRRVRPVDVLLPVTALAIGSALGLLFFGAIGARPQLADALMQARVLVKQGFPLILAVGACWAGVRLSRPGAGLGRSVALLALAPLLVVGALVIEAATLPPDAWGTALRGRTLVACITSILLISLPVLAGSLWAMQRGASTRPGLSGAVAGLLAGGAAATVYAFFCIEDSPLFYGLWYVAAIGAATALGALIGPRVLRW